MAKDEKEETQQVNAGEMPIDLVQKLDEMCAQDENSRSAFIRKLIRQEWARRQQPQLLPTVDSGKAKKPATVAA
jgi:metal-responsive CopG/Arc/MetJ family transcriptional regulator